MTTDIRLAGRVALKNYESTAPRRRETGRGVHFIVPMMNYPCIVPFPIRKPIEGFSS